jgi:hypothetical protein
VKFAITFLFSTVIVLLVIPSQVVHAISHAPQIFEHYNEEKSAHQTSDSFFDFFILHVTDNEHTKEKHADHEVPCKHHVSSSTTWIAVVADKIIPNIDPIFTFRQDLKNGFSPANGKITSFSASIWQPPQLV